MARAKDFLKGYFHPGIQSVEVRPSRLPSLHITRISDVKALTERVGCCVASAGLIEEGNGRTKCERYISNPAVCTLAGRRGYACTRRLLELVVASGTGALPLPPVAELEKLETSPRGRYLRVRPSLELSFPWHRFSDGQPRFAEMWPRLDLYPARDGNRRYGWPSLFPRSGAGCSAALPAADPKMEDQSWRMAALSGEVREVHTPGSRGGWLGHCPVPRPPVLRS